jgi:hypothetical protein
MDTACASPGKYSIPGAMVEEFILSYTVAAGSAVIVSALSPKAGHWYGLTPGSPGRPKPRPCGQLKDRIFSQVKRELGVGYSTLRRLLERETDVEALGFMRNEDQIYLGIDEHSFRHQELVHTVTEVKQRRVVGILKDDRIATLKEFLGKIPKDKVKEVCIDMKEGLRKAAEAVFPLAKVVVDPFHVVADSNKRMDEARRIEQDVYLRRKVQIPKKIFLVGREKLTEEKRQKVDAC